MTGSSTGAIFLALIIALVIVIIILAGVCWKFLGPGIMRRLLRPRRCPSGERVTILDFSVQLQIYNFQLLPSCDLSAMFVSAHN